MEYLDNLTEKIERIYRNFAKYFNGLNLQLVYEGVPFGLEERIIPINFNDFFICFSKREKCGKKTKNKTKKKTKKIIPKKKSHIHRS